MRLYRVLFILALSLLKSEGRNFDRDCFNYTHSANSTAMFGSGLEYLPLLPFMEYAALVNLTHSIANWTSDQDNIGLDVIWTTFFRLESGHQKVVELNAEGELPEENPRELTIALDGTQIEAAIGEHTMRWSPSSDGYAWHCWDMSRPLYFGEVLQEHTTFCRNYTELHNYGENGTETNLHDNLVIEVSLIPPTFGVASRQNPYGLIVFAFSIIYALLK